jgi:2-methylcitrate dehydratase PrpD
VEVTLKLKNGASLSKRIDVLKGNPMNPTTEEEDIAKFSECVKYGIKKMGAGTRDKLVELILNLEKLPDVCELTDYLA